MTDVDVNFRSREPCDEEILPSKRLRIGTHNPGHWKISAILDKQYMELVTSRNAIAISLKDKRNISSIVTKLDKYFALAEKDRFIKRVRIKEGSEISILVHIFETEKEVCTVGEFRTNNQDQLNNIGQEIIKCDIFPTEVPAESPKTRAQFEAAKHIWPCHFHENKILESTLNATRQDVWGIDSLNSHIGYMQHAINSCGKSENAAVIVDPKTYMHIYGSNITLNSVVIVFLL